MKDISYTEVVRFITLNATPDELKKIADMAWGRRQEIRDAEANKIPWRVGSVVQLKPELQHRKPYGAEGVVEKVNQKKLKVAFPNATWTIPKTMLQIAEQKAATAS